MSKHTVNLPNLVIANTATDSTTPITQHLDDAYAVMITAPAALTGTVTVRTSSDNGVTYGDHGSGGTDITVGAGNTVTLTDIAFNALKVTSSLAEGAERTFKVSKSILVA